jgi:hypothetical protein
MNFPTWTGECDECHIVARTGFLYSQDGGDIRALGSRAYSWMGVCQILPRAASAWVSIHPSAERLVARSSGSDLLTIKPAFVVQEVRARQAVCIRSSWSTNRNSQEVIRGDVATHHRIVGPNILRKMISRGE